MTSDKKELESKFIENNDVDTAKRRKHNSYFSCKKLHPEVLAGGQNKNGLAEV